MKQTAVDYIKEKLMCNEYWYENMTFDQIFDQAKAMEKEQRGYSEEDVIKIVEKSRETGLTAEFLLLTFKSE